MGEEAKPAEGAAMSLRKRVVSVLQEWCGAPILHSNWNLQELWNATKPTGVPSHSGIDFYPPGATDLVDKLTSEYQRPRRQKRTINFAATNLNPTGGTILTMENLFRAVQESPEVGAAPADAVLAAAPAKKTARKAAAKRTPRRRRTATKQPD
jgi:hypothetical protein